MNKNFGWLILSAMLFSTCQPASVKPSQEDKSTLSKPATSAVAPKNPGVSAENDVFALFRAGLIEDQQHLSDDLSEASFYTIEFTIQDDIVSVEGVENVRYTNRESVPLDEILFRLMPNVLGGEMTVATVQVEGQPAEPSYELQNSLMRVPLNQPLQPGDSLDMKIGFSVVVPTEVDTFYGLLAYYDGVLALAHAYPLIAVYNDEGWNAEIPSNKGDPTYADASFFIVTVDAPEELVLAGAGREISREDNGSRQIVTYAAGPARDFFLAASENYEIISQTVGKVTFNSYAPDDMHAGAQMAIEVSISAFEFFENTFIPYPYTEYDIVATPTGALGIEFPGIIVLNEIMYPLDGSSYGTPNPVLMGSTAVHEAGHQWFYNLVGNDQLDEPWLDESLTQFMTWQYYIDQHGRAGARGFEEYLYFRWSRVDSQPIPIGKPVADYPGSSYSPVVYGRGPFFFEALREEMGADVFELFLKDYMVRNSWGIGTGENLKALAEEHCNCDLTELFDDWVTP